MGVPPEPNWDDESDQEDFPAFSLDDLEAALDAVGDGDLDDGDEDWPVSVEDAMIAWREGLAWHTGQSLFSVLDMAAEHCVMKPAERHLWIPAIRRLHDSGLFDRELALGLINGVVRRFFDEGEHREDPVLVALDERMRECGRRHGCGEFEDLRYKAYQPPEWLEMEAQYKAREQAMWGEIFTEVGEHELWELRRDHRTEYHAIMERVNERLRADETAAYRSRKAHEKSGRPQRDDG
jgi:hypothetical protein